MNQAQFIKLLFLAVGFLAGIFISNIDFLCNFKSSSSVMPMNPDSIKKEVAIKEKSYSKEVDILNVKDSILSQQKQGTSTALRQRKMRHNGIVDKINSEISKPENTTDSTFNNIIPERIKVDISNLLISDLEKDSLYMQMVDVLTQQVDVKDSIIIVQGDQHLFLKNKLAESLSNQQAIFNKNLIYQKQIKQHKKKNKLLSVATLLLGGVAAASLLHH
jgi:hypothetical protein